MTGTLRVLRTGSVEILKGLTACRWKLKVLPKKNKRLKNSSLDSSVIKMKTPGFGSLMLYEYCRF